MTLPASPVLHTPAHKQPDPAAQPGQIVNPLPRNVCVHAVQQDKEQAQ